MRGPTLILFAALAATLPGCQESGFDERKETAKPLKVQHALGESKVPGTAERPVTLTTPALDDSLALGVTPPLAALPAARIPSYLRARARGVEAIAPVTIRELAAIESAEPDVIVGSAPAQEHLFDELRAIAPTVMLDGVGVRWKLDLRLQGEALGRTNAAERLLIDYDRRSGRLRERLGKSAGETKVSVVRVTPRQVWMAGLYSFPGTVIGDVGLGRPPAQEGRRAYETVAPDRIPALDGDLLLLSVARGGGEALRRLEARPQWRRLRAVRAGRVVRVSDGVWWSGGGALAARDALQELARAL